MAAQRATATGKAFVDEFKSSARCRRDVIAVEIDQMRFAGHTVGVVARRTSRLNIDHMLPMRLERLIRQNAATAVAFIAERIAGRAFRVMIGH